MGVNPRTLDNVTAETIGKTRKRQETLTKYTKKENYFVQFDKKSQKEHDFATQQQEMLFICTGQNGTMHTQKNTTDDKRDRLL